MDPSSADRPLRINPLAICSPPSASRAWQTAPHPHLPLVATACSDKTVRIYSLTSFTLLSTITGGHKRSVRCCAWKPSLPPNAGSANAGESILATGSFDASAAIWVGRPRALENQDRDFGEQNDIMDEDDREEEDDEDYRFAVVLEGHDSEIKSIAWSVHGTFLATCSRDKSVWIWEALDADSGAIGRAGSGGADEEDNYETVAVMQEHDGDVKCVAWHPAEEQCLASASYDEMVRIWREDIDGEWGCVGVAEGHKGTVWCVEWEPIIKNPGEGDGLLKSDSDEPQAASGPRLMSCSDDKSIRLWRRKPKVRPGMPTGPRVPSIIRSSSDEEDWYEEVSLPQRHDRAIYSVSWSKKSKRVVSCGSDGRIVVYEERQIARSDEDSVMTNGVEAPQNDDNDERANGTRDVERPTTEWAVLAEMDAAHGVFEVNHVCWASRFDRSKLSNDEEVIISTGDDGEVKVWNLEAV